MTVKMAHLESPYFVTGLRVYANESNNHRIRIAVAKIVRQIERKTKEPFEDYQDLLRAYGKKNKDGNLEVVPAELSQDQADKWVEESDAWREQTIELESDLFKDGILEMKLPEVSLNKIPYMSMEALLDYVEFVKDDAKGEVELLRERVAQLEAQVKASDKE
jgi:polyhydroxyalkanoate synthesis regulator phasin